MKRLSRIYALEKLLFLAILFSTNYSVAQELSKEQLEKSSVAYFNESKYELAAAGFEKLISIYSKEPSYNYYLGICYLKSNTLNNKAIEYLRYAASKNFRADAHYYLALAYYRNYMFDDAEIALVNFINLAKNKDLLKLKPQILQASLKKAQEETYMAAKNKVLSKEELIKSQIENVYALHINGKFSPKAASFMLKPDIDVNYQGIMYFPLSSIKGFKYFIPSIGKSGRTGKDIMISEQRTAINFTIPEPVKEINSKYNEEYPYYDCSNKVLYFSSDREGGLGGYDIYKSEYDETAQCFNEPKRLEFPINTPYDDYLFVPDSAGKTAIFLSNRNNKSGKLTAYKIELTNAPSFVFPQSQSEIKELAALDVTINPSEAPVVIENLSPAKKPVIKSEYDLVLQDALSKQLTCDSLQAVLISKKNLLRVESDMDKRRIMLATIASTEEQLKFCQAAANELFSKAQQLQYGTTVEHDILSQDKSDTTIKPGEEANELKVFAYQPGSYLNNHVKIETNPVLAQKTDSVTNFEILSNSPYSVNRPIPFDDDLPVGLVYRIQLGAFSQGLSINTFGGLVPLSAEKIPDRNLVKYYVGYFASSKEARKALEEVKNYGFSDAFLVPYYGKEKISIESAREIEFGNK